MEYRDAAVSCCESDFTEPPLSGSAAGSSTSVAIPAPTSPRVRKRKPKSKRLHPYIKPSLASYPPLAPSSEDERVYTCPHCTRTFTYLANYRRHLEDICPLRPMKPVPVQPSPTAIPQQVTVIDKEGTTQVMMVVVKDEEKGGAGTEALSGAPEVMTMEEVQLNFEEGDVTFETGELTNGAGETTPPPEGSSVPEVITIDEADQTPEVIDVEEGEATEVTKKLTPKKV